MLFGASTMTFYRRPLPQALEAIASCGFDYAEIWVDHAWDASCGADTESIRAVLQRCGLRATVHCPILDINITSANRGIRAESIRQNLLAIDFTKSIGADLFVLHPGSRFSVRESVAAHWDYQIEALIKILAYARQRQVVAALENMDSAQENVSIQNRGDFKRLFAALGIKNGSITLDTTHLRTTEKVVAFIEELSEQIVHLHLSDADGEQMHLRLGEGRLGLERIIHALKNVNYQGVCSLECFVPNNEALLKLELQKARALWA